MIVALLWALAGQPAELELDERWKAVTIVAEDAPALVLRDGAKATLAVTVSMVPGMRDRVEEILAGWKTQEGVRVVDHELTTIEGVPCLDLELRRGKTKIGVRMLLFRSRVITAISEGDVAAARALQPQI